MIYQYIKEQLKLSSMDPLENSSLRNGYLIGKYGLRERNMRKTRPSKENYFLALAKQVSKRSTCLRRQVGAVIVSEDGYVVATGYNGVPSGIVSCMEKGFCYRQKHKIKSGTQYETCQSIHAEQNAIIQAGIRLCKNSVMYIYGHDFVCMMCKRFIVQSGLSKVIIKMDSKTPTQVVSLGKNSSKNFIEVG